MELGREQQKLERAGQLLANARAVVVLTGAGLSAGSGLPTFRGAGPQHDFRRISGLPTLEDIESDPAGFWRWYDQQRELLRDVDPGPGHKAIAELERRVMARGGLFRLLTQNIDGLHQAAGSARVVELSGSAYRTRCAGCGRRDDLGLQAARTVPNCQDCGHPRRPDVVWPGERPSADDWRSAVATVEESDLLLLVGTSLMASTARSLVDVAVRTRLRIIEINPEATVVTPQADVAIHARAGDALWSILAGL